MRMQTHACVFLGDLGQHCTMSHAGELQPNVLFEVAMTPEAIAASHPPMPVRAVLFPQSLQVINL